MSAASPTLQPTNKVPSMQIVPLASVEVRSRRRSTIAPGPLLELKEGILTVGNLHPPVCWFDEAKQMWVLSVGERRLRAIQRIAEEGKTYYANNTPIPPGFIGILTLYEALDDAGRLEAEIFENIQRVDFDWRDKVQALADLHNMRHTATGQTMAKTAEELAKERGSTARAAHEAIRRATLIAAHLGNEKIANARNAEEARVLIFKQEEERINGAIARKVIASSPMGGAGAPISIRHTDLTTLLPALEGNVFDFILADPPYGIGAGAGGFRQRTVHHHNYADTPEEARSIALCILTEGFRLTKSRANLILFTDIRHWEWLQSTSANMGWSPFRYPLIWQKSESEGLAPWGGSGPRITTEMIFYATKGARGMHASPTNVFTIPRVSRSERLHAAEKPVELLAKLLKCCSLPGDMVLDPCCGSGSTLVACREERRQCLGIEKDIDYYNTAMANVFGSRNNPEAQL